MECFLILLWLFMALCKLSDNDVTSQTSFQEQESLRITGGSDGDPHPTFPYPKERDPKLFTRRYSEQTFIGTHDSPAIRTKENDWSLSGNQYFNLSTQLNSGVRLIQAQGHRSSDGSERIRLCHFKCALMDGGSLDEYLSTTKAWLEKNPREVVTFVFVSAGPSLFQWARTYHRAGFDAISYTPPTEKRGNMDVEDWPTIEEMVHSGKRAVTFLSSQADESIAPWLLSEWGYLFETNFGIESPDQFSCTPSRPRPPYWGAPIPSNRLSLVNHFLYASFLGFRYPNISYVEHTNGASFMTGELGEHAVRCREMYNRRPNFLLVDFWSEGNVWEVEEGLNNY